jgi:PKD repeat protein
LKIAVVVAAAVMAFVGTAAPAVAEGVQQEDYLTSKVFTTTSKQAPVGGGVRIRGLYYSSQGAEFLCETDFGDGQVNNGACDNVWHAYSQPGTYQVTQTARSATGVEAVSTGSILVVPQVGPLTVTATATLSGPLTVVVHNNPVGGYDVTWVRVYWTGGTYTSGPAAGMENIDYTYSEPGTYVIKVRVYDSSGASAETTTTVEVV